MSSTQATLFFIRKLLPLSVFFQLWMHADGQCSRNSTNTSISPTFLCVYNVTVTRLPGCSTQINETIVFPHDAGDSWYRDIPSNSGGDISEDSIVVTRDDEPTAFSFNASNRRVTVPTTDTELPVMYELMYQVEDSISKYLGDCQFSNYSISNDGPRNHMAWSVGPWGKPIDVLNVRFTTNGTAAKLQFANEEDGNEEGSDISVRKTDVKEDISVHVLEDGTEPCGREWRCSSSTSSQSTVKNGLVIAIVVGILLLFVPLGYACYLIRSGKSREFKLWL